MNLPQASSFSCGHPKSRCSPQTSVPHSPAQAGFTLIELICGIAVIIVLASILIPALGNARQRGDSAQCIANLRQLHSGHMLWANDNANILPYSYTPAGEGTPAANATYVNEMKRFSSYISEGSKRPGVDANTSGYSSPHMCPADGERNPPVGPYNIGYFGFSYGINGRLVSSNQNVAANWKTPSETFFYADATTTIIPGNATYASRYAGRHAGKGNLIFLDGHVETLSVDELPSPVPSTGPTASAFWNAEL